MKNIYAIIGLVSSSLNFSCSEFLDEKPDIKMVVPKSLTDVELLLNDYAAMNMGYPLLGEWATDDYYLTKQSWEAIANQDQRNAYIWKDEPYEDAVQWQRPYKTVYIANQVLEILSGLPKTGDPPTYQRVYGAAHFFRAFAFHQLLEVYAPAYDSSTAGVELGIPLRLSPDIDGSVGRANLSDSYGQVLSDYRIAISNLPGNEGRKGQPHKAAAHAGLARAYLYMGMFAEAYLHADSAIQLSPELMDYNKLKETDNFPVPRFNGEVLFPAMSTNAGPMGFTIALVDSTLYASYAESDLRRTIFFRSNAAPTGSYLYRGNYDRTSAQLFVGLTTSEIYLIKAEAAVRVGKSAEALLALNTLLKKRWELNSFVDIEEADAGRLLAIILQERRKELLFRGRRWADLKRLNTEGAFQKTLVRKIGDQQYTLEPNSPKYAVRLPESVVRIGNLQQNKR
ncbi:membrane protein [Sphingobacterium alkalisoli]|nr:RagB/SusD family nutrient uptake outer membrane protein [Sphingobacterium alkalisoli]GGH10419.1 membrane protein [Sphingobacterium alkalisoli]